MIEANSKKERVVIEFTSGFFVGIVISMLIVFLYLIPKREIEKSNSFRDGKVIGRSSTIIYLNKHYSNNKINYKEILAIEDSLLKWKLKK